MCLIPDRLMGYVTWCKLLQYSKFRHHYNSHSTLKTTLVLLYKLFQYSCLWLIKLTTPCGFSPGCFSIAKVLESAVSQSS